MNRFQAVTNGENEKMAEFIVPNFKFESLSKKLNTIANKCKKAGVDYRMEIGKQVHHVVFR